MLCLLSFSVCLDFDFFLILTVLQLQTQSLDFSLDHCFPNPRQCSIKISTGEVLKTHGNFVDCSLILQNITWV